MLGPVTPRFVRFSRSRCINEHDANAHNWNWMTTMYFRTSVPLKLLIDTLEQSIIVVINVLYTHCNKEGVVVQYGQMQNLTLRIILNEPAC